MKSGLSAEYSKVANIQFAFNNSLMFNHLEKRASYMKSRKFQKVHEQEMYLTKTKNDAELFDYLNTPNTFYCTFHHA